MTMSNRISVASVLFAAALVFLPAKGLHAAKAQFSVGLNPARLSFSVDSRGRITGNKTVTVDVRRIKVGSSYACNKIRTVEVLLGKDPLTRDDQTVMAISGGFPARK